MSDDMKKAAESSVLKHFPAYCAENYPLREDKIEALSQLFIEGAQWQREQMMKHTIEGCYIRRNHYTKTNVLNGLSLTDKVFQNFENRDTLKIIIIKEGDEK